MGNCLVTKLKESVNNDNLRTFNSVLFSVVSQSSQPTAGVKIKVNAAGVTVKAKGDGYFANSVAELTTDSMTSYTFNSAIEKTFYFVNGDYDVEIIGKDKIVTLSSLYFYKLNTVDASYMSSAGKLDTITDGDIADLKGLPAITFLMVGGNAEGNMSELNRFTTLTYLCFNGFSKITGNIQSLSALINLTSLVSSYASNVTGDLDALAAAQAPNRANGSTLAFTGNGKVTYKVGGVDTPIPNGTIKTVIFDGQGGYTIA